MALSNQFSNSDFEYIEKHYRKNDFYNWRDPIWWENESWQNFIPGEEHYRFTKFRNQACKNYNKGEMEGYHFVEILEMIDLKRNGYNWLYENYHLFQNVKPSSKVYYKGTETIKRIIGRTVVEAMYNIVSTMQLKPTEPDLFGYKKHGNGNISYDMIFIEAKKDDEIRENQLLGFQLIKNYLKIPIRVVRYVNGC